MKDKNVIGGSLILIFVIIFGFMGKSIEMGILVAAGGIVLSFLNLDKIQKFKGGGFEAEMKRAVEEANATIEQLREVATSSSEAILTDLMAGNFMSGTTLAKRLELRDQLITNLSDIGASESQIKKANEMWDKGVSIIFHRGLRCAIANTDNVHTIPSDLGDDVKKSLQEFQELIEFDKWHVPSSDVLKEFINDKNIMNTNVEELLNDCAHFEKTGLLQRRDVFVKL